MEDSGSEGSLDCSVSPSTNLTNLTQLESTDSDSDSSSNSSSSDSSDNPPSEEDAYGAAVDTRLTSLAQKQVWFGCQCTEYRVLSTELVVFSCM